jgi:hypothetical protein
MPNLDMLVIGERRHCDRMAAMAGTRITYALEKLTNVPNLEQLSLLEMHYLLVSSFICVYL